VLVQPVQQPDPVPAPAASPDQAHLLQEGALPHGQGAGPKLDRVVSQRGVQGVSAKEGAELLRKFEWEGPPRVRI
jgi:hypothetical protein